MATLQSLENQVMSLGRAMAGLDSRISTIEKGQAIFVSKADLQVVADSLQNNIDALGRQVAAVETKLTMISLPDDTRYYLKDSEVTDFRNNFRQLRAMMIELEKTRQAFIKLASRYNLTNSSL